MRSNNLSTKLSIIAIVLAVSVTVWTSWPTRHVHAIQDSEDFPPPFGLASGQTARLTLFNSGDTAIVGPEYKFLNSRGEVLRESADTIIILPGHFRSVDFNLPNPPPGTPPDAFGRIQLRAQVTSIGNPDVKTLTVSVEVFDNATGRTSFVIQPPPEPD